MLTPNDIVCYIPVYNDAEALERCLGKLQIMGIKGLVIDGRFTDFPQINDSDISTDNTVEVCKRYGAHYGCVAVGREQDKFNWALDVARDYGYEVFMFCGADAWYEADMPEFMLDLQRYYEQYAVEPTQLIVHTTEMQPDSKWNNTGTRQPRVILNYWKLEARYLHWTMYERNAHDTNPLSASIEVLEGIRLYHDNTVRPRERDDMMTEYQNTNVPRERRMYMKHIVPKAYTKVVFMVWYIDEDGSYEQARDLFFSKSKNYTHMLLVLDGWDVSYDQINQFRSILNERDNIMDELPLISAVWKSKTHKNHFTLDPDGIVDEDFGKFDKIRALYSPKGLPNDSETILVAPYTIGPVICMNTNSVRLIEHMGDNLDFLAIRNGLGLQVYADSRIQF